MANETVSEVTSKNSKSDFDAPKPEDFGKNPEPKTSENDFDKMEPKEENEPQPSKNEYEKEDPKKPKESDKDFKKEE
jgi:hypothetical protein